MIKTKKVLKTKKPKALTPSEKIQFLSGGLVVFASFILLFFGLKLIVSNLAAIVNFSGSVQTVPLIWQVSRETAQRPAPLPDQQRILSDSKDSSLSGEKPRQLSNRETDKEKYFVVPGPHQNLDEDSFLASPDGQSFAYILRRDNTESVAINGRISAAHEQITFMRFSPDSRHFAYGVRDNNLHRVFIDGEAGASYNFLIPPFSFSPDSQYFLYKAATDGGQVMVVNNQAGRVYDRLYDPVINPDEKKIFYFGLLGSILWRTELDLK